MKSFYYFLVGISSLVFGFRRYKYNAYFELVNIENPSPQKRLKPQPKSIRR
jgi:hypothetical protein